MDSFRRLFSREKKDKSEEVLPPPDARLQVLRHYHGYHPDDTLSLSSHSAQSLPDLQDLMATPDQGKEEQRQNTARKFGDAVTETMCARTGFQGELFIEHDSQDPDVPSQSVLSPELRAALHRLKVADTKKTKPFLKLDSNELKNLSDYLKKDPVRFPNPLESFPNIIKDSEAIRNFLEKVPFGDSFSPEESLSLLKTAESTQRAKFAFEDTIRTLRRRKPITLEKHVTDVLRRFEVCFAGWWNSNANSYLEGADSILELHHMRILLKLHDLGKTLMKASAHQDIPIMTLAPEVLKKVAPDAADRIFSFYKLSMGTLYRQLSDEHSKRPEILGQVLGKLSNEIIDISKQFNVSPKAVASVLDIEYICDAGSYPAATPWYPIEYNEVRGLYKFTRDEKRQRGHDMLFERLTERMHERAIDEVTNLPSFDKRPSAKSWVKQVFGHPSLPRRVNKQVEALKETGQRLEGYLNTDNLNLPQDLASKYDEAVYAIAGQIQASLGAATDHYREKASKQYRPRRHTGEEELEAMHRTLTNLTTDLEILPRAINVLTQARREDDLKKLKTDYTNILDDYQLKTAKSDQEREQTRTEFMTWIKDILPTTTSSGGGPVT